MNTAKQTKQYKSISAQVTLEEYKEIRSYCQQNKIKISDLVRKSISAQMEADRDFRILKQCEEMIDHKLNIVNVNIPKMRVITGEVINP